MGTKCGCPKWVWPKCDFGPDEWSTNVYVGPNGSGPKGCLAQMGVTQMCLWPNCVWPKCLRPKKSDPKECGPNVIVAQMCHSRFEAMCSALLKEKGSKISYKERNSGLIFIEFYNMMFVA